MKTSSLPENGSKSTNRPVTPQQAPLPVIGSGEVCRECLNEDFDSCVCPEPEN